MPKISVIVLTYEREYHLRRCLRSLENQRYQDFEVIVSDAGSGERNTEVARDWREILPAMKVVSHPHKFTEEGGGVHQCAMTANNALRMVEGEYIQFLQADHILNPLYLQHLVNFFMLLPRQIIQPVILGLVSNLAEEVTFEDIDALAKLEHAPGAEHWPAYPRWDRFYALGMQTLIPCPDWRAIDGFDCAVPADICESFDEEFEGQGHEHMDWVYRMARNGAQFLSSPLLRHYHQPHEENRPAEQWNKELEVSTALFTKKHGEESWKTRLG